MSGSASPGPAPPALRVPTRGAGEASVALVLADGSGAPEQPTTVRVGWDDAALRVRFDCQDRDIWGTLSRRDDPLWTEEAVEVFLAPGPEDPAEYFELEVSPGGVLFDARVANRTGRREDRVADRSWDCPGIRWGASIDRTAARWAAELSIPWRGIAPGEPLPRVWRANFYRIERPRDGAAEFSAWSPTLADPPDFHRPARFGTLLLV